MTKSQEMANINKRTKDDISFSFFRLLFKRSYHDISITEICELSKVSRTTFYRYFRDKEDILIVFIDDRFEEFFRNLLNNYKQISLRDVIFEIMSIVYRYRLQIIKLIDAGKQQILHDQFLYYFRYLFRQAQNHTEQPEITNISSPEFIYSTSFYAGAIYSTVLTWAEHNMEGTPEEITRSLIDVFERVSDMNAFKPFIFIKSS